MKMMTAALALPLLAGCAQTAPPPRIVPVATSLPMPTPPLECRAESHPWRELPDRDVADVQLKAAWRANKDQYRTLQGEKLICGTWVAKLTAPEAKAPPVKEARK